MDHLPSDTYQTDSKQLTSLQAAGGNQAQMLKQASLVHASFQNVVLVRCSTRTHRAGAWKLVRPTLL